VLRHLAIASGFQQLVAALAAESGSERWDVASD